MAQAKTLTKEELDRVLQYVKTRRYAQRDRALILISYYSGLRVGEIALLRMMDVIHPDGTIKDEIRLSAAQTKGGHPRTVFVSQKLKVELMAYLETKLVRRPEIPFFHTDKRLGFSANSLCQWYFWAYRGAGISGASSHSGRRTFLTNLANKGTAIHILKTLAGHRSISTTAAYLYSSPSQLKAAVELV
jgi:integrase/recombinase XerD